MGKDVPPRGMSLNQDDLKALGTGQGEEMMEGLDRDIASCKRAVQNNKQLLSGLRRKTREVENTMASYRGEQTDVVSARWTEQELLLGVEGVRMPNTLPIPPSHHTHSTTQPLQQGLSIY